jgi:hypothetical protein
MQLQLLPVWTLQVGAGLQLEGWGVPDSQLCLCNLKYHSSSRVHVVRGGLQDWQVCWQTLCLMILFWHASCSSSSTDAQHKAADGLEAGCLWFQHLKQMLGLGVGLEHVVMDCILRSF